MLPLYTFTTPPSSCSYLADRKSQLQYDIVAQLTPEEYQSRVLQGWRRFGYAMFRPVCSRCQACQSLRVDVARFRPNQSQKRAWKANQDLTLSIGEPKVEVRKLRLYDRFHTFQTGFKDWPRHDPESPENYAASFVENPFPTQEWTYWLEDQLLGVGYVDRLPEGLSAIYFYYEPDCRQRSLGTFNVLSVIAAAAQLKLPYVYLGYFVEGCRSLEYKQNFKPNQVLTSKGIWQDFRKG